MGTLLVVDTGDVDDIYFDVFGYWWFSGRRGDCLWVPTNLAEPVVVVPPAGLEVGLVRASPEVVALLHGFGALRWLGLWLARWWWCLQWWWLELVGGSNCRWPRQPSCVGPPFGMLRGQYGF